MNFLKETLASFRRSVQGFDTPGQLAIGVTFGMLIGLVPKDSLFPYAIGIFAILSTGNLLCVAVSAIVFSWASPVLDPVSHQLGAWILTFDPFESALSSAYQLPLVPWTRFNNTVVTGSLLLGTILILPTYALSFHFFEKFGSTIFKLVADNRAARWLIGTPKPNLQES